MENERSNLIKRRNEMLEDEIGDEELVELAGPVLKKVLKTKESMHEFLTEDMGCYCPGKRDLTAKFCRAVFRGDKELLLSEDV